MATSEGVLVPQKLNVQYRTAAEEFARKVVASLGEQVNSIVLFGSVARKRATKESDVDILVVGANSALEDGVFDIAYEVGEASGFETYLSTVYFTREEVQELVRLGSSFIANVFEQGVILYDDGTFSGIRSQAIGAS